MPTGSPVGTAPHRTRVTGAPWVGAGPRRAGHTTGPAGPSPSGGDHDTHLPLKRAEQRTAAAGSLPSRRHLRPHRPGGGKPRLSPNSPPPHKLLARPPHRTGPTLPHPRSAPYLRGRAPAASGERSPAAPHRAAPLRRRAGLRSNGPAHPAPPGQWAPLGLRAPRWAAPPRWAAANGGAGQAAKAGAGRRQGATEDRLPAVGRGGRVRGGRARADASCRCSSRREPLVLSR